MLNHLDMVANVKRQLEAAGVDLSGPCGAFQITKRVAWNLRGEGAGLLAKPGGNNCEGFATDIVMYQSGELVDILRDGGGENGAQWNETGEIRPTDQWRAPQFYPVPQPDTPPTPPPDSGGGSTPDYTDAFTALAVQADRNTDSIIARDDANTKQIMDRLEQIVEDAEQTLGDLLKELLPIIIAGRPPGLIPPEGPTIRRLMRKAL